MSSDGDSSDEDAPRSVAESPRAGDGESQGGDGSGASSDTRSVASAPRDDGDGDSDARGSDHKSDADDDGGSVPSDDAANVRDGSDGDVAATETPAQGDKPAVAASAPSAGDVHAPVLPADDNDDGSKDTSTSSAKSTGNDNAASNAEESKDGAAGEHKAAPAEAAPAATAADPAVAKSDVPATAADNAAPAPDKAAAAASADKASSANDDSATPAGAAGGAEDSKAKEGTAAGAAGAGAGAGAAKAAGEHGAAKNAGDDADADGDAKELAPMKTLSKKKMPPVPTVSFRIDFNMGASKAAADLKREEANAAALAEADADGILNAISQDFDAKRPFEEAFKDKPLKRPLNLFDWKTERPAIGTWDPAGFQLYLPGGARPRNFDVLGYQCIPQLSTHDKDMSPSVPIGFISMPIVPSALPRMLPRSLLMPLYFSERRRASDERFRMEQAHLARRLADVETEEDRTAAAELAAEDEQDRRSNMLRSARTMKSMHDLKATRKNVDLAEGMEKALEEVERIERADEIDRRAKAARLRRRRRERRVAEVQAAVIASKRAKVLRDRTTLKDELENNFDPMKDLVDPKELEMYLVIHAFMPRAACPAKDCTSTNHIYLMMQPWVYSDATYSYELNEKQLWSMGFFSAKGVRPCHLDADDIQDEHMRGLEAGDFGPRAVNIEGGYFRPHNGHIHVSKNKSCAWFVSAALSAKAHGRDDSTRQGKKESVDVRSLLGHAEKPVGGGARPLSAQSDGAHSGAAKSRADTATAGGGGARGEGEGDGGVSVAEDAGEGKGADGSTPDTPSSPGSPPPGNRIRDKYMSGSKPPPSRKRSAASTASSSSKAGAQGKGTAAGSGMAAVAAMAARSIVPAPPEPEETDPELQFDAEPVLNLPPWEARQVITFHVLPLTEKKDALLRDAAAKSNDLQHLLFYISQFDMDLSDRIKAYLDPMIEDIIASRKVPLRAAVAAKQGKGITALKAAGAFGKRPFAGTAAAEGLPVSDDDDDGSRPSTAPQKPTPLVSDTKPPPFTPPGASSQALRQLNKLRLETKASEAELLTRVMSEPALNRTGDRALGIAAAGMTASFVRSFRVAHGQGKKARAEELKEEDRHPVLAAFSAVPRDDYPKLVNFRKPPKAVVATAAAVCLLLGEPPTWPAARNVFNSPDFVERVLYLHVSEVHKKAAKAINKIVRLNDIVDQARGTGIKALMVTALVVDYYNRKLRLRAQSTRRLLHPTKQRDVAAEATEAAKKAAEAAKAAAVETAGKAKSKVKGLMRGLSFRSRSSRGSKGSQDSKDNDKRDGSDGGSGGSGGGGEGADGIRAAAAPASPGASTATSPLASPPPSRPGTADTAGGEGGATAGALDSRPGTAGTDGSGSVQPSVRPGSRPDTPSGRRAGAGTPMGGLSAAAPAVVTDGGDASGSGHVAAGSGSDGGGSGGGGGAGRGGPASGGASESKGDAAHASS